MIPCYGAHPGPQAWFVTQPREMAGLTLCSFRCRGKMSWAEDGASDISGDHDKIIHVKLLVDLCLLLSSRLPDASRWNPHVVAVRAASDWSRASSVFSGVQNIV